MVSLAITDGSFNTIPSFLTHIKVLAVPRSIAISDPLNKSRFDKNDENIMIPLKYLMKK
tara:strand:- start:1739 stop:1915 length:177 start_codon:yes stop_codon:yes gene_type:complete